MSDEIFIETYRGFEVTFDRDRDRFSVSIDDGKWHEKQSYSAVKKLIDEHIKANLTFQPFKIVQVQNIFRNEKRLTVVSIRKDGRFVGEDDKGEKVQISDYEEKSWILDLPENEIHFANIAMYKAEIESWNNKIKEEERLIKAPTLESLKPKYLIP